MILKEKIYESCRRLKFGYLSLNFNNGFLPRIKKAINFYPRPAKVLIEDKQEKANFLFFLNSIDKKWS
jgi:hypothetical protein